jgi:hypothetical protein
MVKAKQAIALEQPQAVRSLSSLNFENAPPQQVLSALAFELREMAGGIDALADMSLEMSMTASGASLRFRAYSRPPRIF